MKKFIVSISFCVAVFVFSTTEAFGCKCLVEKLVENEYQRKTAIFSGKVVGIVKDGAFIRRVKIRVENSWKGDAAKIVTITTPSDGGMCGYSFVKGASYLIYANGNEKNGLLVDICSRTKGISDAQEDIETLNNLQKETKSSPK